MTISCNKINRDLGIVASQCLYIEGVGEGEGRVHVQHTPHHTTFQNLHTCLWKPEFLYLYTVRLHNQIRMIILH